ncbi:hypothetical protein SynBIOSE41_02713 [Synechococcus sp. BIOS-E4-1]|nr:hypothetical protein SynBIOSE41_02713 [Synechococcus sp. BIOS-E4-1]
MLLQAVDVSRDLVVHRSGGLQQNVESQQHPSQAIDPHSLAKAVAAGIKSSCVLHRQRDCGDVGLIQPAVIFPMVHGDVVAHALRSDGCRRHLADAADCSGMPEAVELHPGESPF